MTGFAYQKAGSLPEALAALGQSGKPVVLLAGGTNLMPNIRSKGQKPALLLDITALEELRGIREVEGRIRLGALTTLAELAASERVAKKAPALRQAALRFACPTTRRRATLGGNLCNASPGADSAPPLLALDASVTLESERGERSLPLAEFFTGSFATALQPGELLKWVEFSPCPASAFLKLGHRNAMAISITSMAVALQTDESGALQRCRVAYGASGATPLRATQTEAMLCGQKPSAELFAQAAETLAQDLHPRDGLRGSKKYRQSVAVTLLKRGVLSLVETP